MTNIEQLRQNVATAEAEFGRRQNVAHEAAEVLAAVDTDDAATWERADVEQRRANAAAVQARTALEVARAELAAAETAETTQELAVLREQLSEEAVARRMAPIAERATAAVEALNAVMADTHAVSVDLRETAADATSKARALGLESNYSASDALQLLEYFVLGELRKMQAPTAGPSANPIPTAGFLVRAFEGG